MPLAPHGHPQPPDASQMLPRCLQMPPTARIATARISQPSQTPWPHQPPDVSPRWLFQWSSPDISARCIPQMSLIVSLRRQGHLEKQLFGVSHWCHLQLDDGVDLWNNALENLNIH